MIAGLLLRCGSVAVLRGRQEAEAVNCVTAQHPSPGKVVCTCPLQALQLRAMHLHVAVLSKLVSRHEDGSQGRESAGPAEHPSAQPAQGKKRRHTVSEAYLTVSVIGPTVLKSEGVPLILCLQHATAAQ